MENLDVLVLRSLRDWRMAGRHAVLVTVVGTWGSAPRPVGSIMALATDGSVCGSVSGGCIEDDLVAQYCHGSSATRGLAGDAPRRLTYGMDADEAHRFGLPCGGTLELLLEFDPDADALGEMLALLDAGKLVQRAVSLADGRARCAQVDAPTPLCIRHGALTSTFGPEYRMLLIGAGQLAQYLSTMALFCGFRVTVCDPRAEYRSAWALAGVALTSAMPDDAVRSFKLDRRSCVVALSHDPKLDDLALLEALQSEAFYVGAIGSRRNAQARRQRMVHHFDHTEESLGLLHSPVGVFIGSKTPSEIAVSIMAEVIAVRNAIRLPNGASMAVANQCMEV